MKKLEIIIRPEKLENLKAILEGCKVNGIMISNVMGYGNQKGYTQMYRGTKYNVNLLPKVKVETVIPKELADPIIDAVVDEINTGNYGDGKIFVYDVQDAPSGSAPESTDEGHCNGAFCADGTIRLTVSIQTPYRIHSINYQRG